MHTDGMKQVLGLVLTAGLVVLLGMWRGGPHSAAVGLLRQRPSRTAAKPACRGAATSSCATVTGAVVRVVDGDTVILRMRGRPHRVRLIGVDAPETWLHHDCFGTDATRALRRLVPPGSLVHAVADTEPHDRYGRLLLYLWTPSGVFVNATLIRHGFARTMVIPPNNSRATALREAERTARQTQAGIWRACAPTRPWETERHRPPDNRTWP